MNKKILISGIIGMLCTNITAFGKMEVENFGVEGVGIMGQGIYISTNENTVKNQEVFDELLNLNKESIRRFDTDNELEIKPYLNYIGIKAKDKKETNYGLGIVANKKINDEYIVGININALKTKAKNNDEGYKGLVNLSLAYQGEKSDFTLMPFYYTTQTKNENTKNKINYAGLKASYKEDLEILDATDVSYEIDFVGARDISRKEKKERDVVIGKVGINAKQEMLNINGISVNLKGNMAYEYNFKPTKDNNKSRAIVGVGIEFQKDNCSLEISNKFKKSLNSRDYQNMSSVSISFKF